MGHTVNSTEMKLIIWSILCFLCFSSAIRTKPPQGQRCSGRNYSEKRCCTPEKPCGLGEGDCDGPLDGGLSDGDLGCKGDLVCGSNNCQKFGLYFHKGDCDGPGDGGMNDGDRGCKGDLVCGRNNCKKYGSWYHEKDDCCEKPASPPTGQRCAGSNYDGRRCCTPDNPCDEGEGNCDSPGDGDRGCKGDMVCGRNNCKQYGFWYHEKDDCCEKPSYQGWGAWEAWSSCNTNSGLKSRVRYCHGTKCSRTQWNQDRPC